jgi:hypothetical protein
MLAVPQLSCGGLTLPSSTAIEPHYCPPGVSNEALPEILGGNHKFNIKTSIFEATVPLIYHNIDS